MNDGMNRVILLGNLGADPELRYTTSGVAVLSIRLATNESYLDKNKEPQARTEWHTVVVWGQRAEGLARVLTKGAGVLVEGTLRTSSYERDGQRRYRTEVHARDVFFTGKRALGPTADAAAAIDDGGLSARAPNALLPLKPAVHDEGYAGSADYAGSAPKPRAEGEDASGPGTAKIRVNGLGQARAPGELLDELPY
jgi:single-strand DNA-binding protein